MTVLKQSKPDLPEMTYPALFVCADRASTVMQRHFLVLIVLEYGLLVLAALLASSSYLASYAMVLVAALIVMTWRSLWKPEQEWYRSRALAESVKTSTWRYVMRAKPFANADPGKAKAAFRSYLTEVLAMNAGIGALAVGIEQAGKHTTDEMETVRAADWQTRRDYYLKERIDNQLTWYKKKTGYNRYHSGLWVAFAGTVYAVAIGLAIYRPADPAMFTKWPIEPLLVVAAAIIGWSHIKKFNELASVYTLTALEVQLIHEKTKDVDQEEELPLFVNEAELAFSREHTQWVARQVNQY